MPASWRPGSRSRTRSIAAIPTSLSWGRSNPGVYRNLSYSLNNWARNTANSYQRETVCETYLAGPTRAVSQLLWPDKGREVWFSLGENHEKGSCFGLHQLRKCSKAQRSHLLAFCTLWYFDQDDQNCHHRTRIRKRRRRNRSTGFPPPGLEALGSVADGRDRATGRMS